MKQNRFERVRDILLRVAGQPPANRAAQLSELCEGDEELLAEVQSLLAYDENSLHPVAPGAATTPSSGPGSPEALQWFPARRAGDIVAQYHLLQPIGQGGMGEVWLAEDPRLSRKVAIKFLTAAQDGPRSSQARFINEAKAASSLDHPSIGTIHAFDQDARGQLYIVMAYYGGGSLKEYIASRELRVAEALELTLQICDGLSAAHAQGIIHRDLKPANVMLTRDRQARLIDFGLAKLGDQMGLTKTGSALGTIAYMSPEQVRGKSVDARSDIFSLGVTLYELLTGHIPFDGENEASVLLRITQGQPDPLAKHRRGLPRGLGRILDRALARHPDDRYQSVTEMRQDLRAVLDGQPLRKLIASGFSLRRFLRTHPRLRWGAGVTAGALAITAVSLWTDWFTDPASRLAGLPPRQSFMIHPDGSGDFPTIAAAIEAATHRDTILLANGIYTGEGNRNLNFGGKILVLRSASDQPDSCILDCQGTADSWARGIGFFSGERRDALLQGITIRNGSHGTGGAAVAISASSPTIRNCILENNQVGTTRGFGSAGALGLAGGSDPLIERCVFRGNRATNAGGAVTTGNSTGLIRECLFEGNFAVHGGGAIQFYEASTRIEDCVFRDNDCTHWSNHLFFDRPASNGQVTGCTLLGGKGPAEAVRARAGAAPTLERCLIAFNPRGPAIALEEAVVTLRCCNLYGNAEGDWTGEIGAQRDQEGNIAKDPLLCNLVDGEPTVHPGSPCLPGNNACEALIGAASVGCESRSVLLVPDTFPDIATALSSAVSGDTVLIAPGHYPIRDQRLPAGVTLRGSTGNPTEVILDAGGTGRVLVCDGLEDGARIEALTLTGGKPVGIFPDNVGGGLACFGSDLELNRCIVRDCEAESAGGIYVQNARQVRLTGVTIRDNYGQHHAGGFGCVRAESVRLQDCRFVGNHSLHQGGGAHFEHCRVSIQACEFQENAAKSGAAAIVINSQAELGRNLFVRNSTLEGPLGAFNNSNMRGGVLYFAAAEAQIRSCTLVKSLIPKAAGAIGAYQSDLDVAATIIATTRPGRALRKMDDSRMQLMRCNLYANDGGDFIRSFASDLGRNGNLSADPLFVDPQGDDFHIRPHSPCAPDSTGPLSLIGALPVTAQ